MNDGRRPPFCYQTLAAMAVLRERYEARERSTAIAVYQSMTELANEARTREGFSAPRSRLAEYAGVSKDTLDRYCREFEALGLVRVERRQVEGVNLPNEWSLIEPSAVAPVAPDGGWPHANDQGGHADDGGGRMPTTPIQERGEEGEEDARGRAGAQDVVPLFGEDDPLAEVMAVLAEVPIGKGGTRATRESVAAIARDYPEVDLVRVARELEFWAVHGNGKRRAIKSVAGSFRTFVRRSAEDAQRPGTVRSERDERRAAKAERVARGLAAMERLAKGTT